MLPVNIITGDFNGKLASASFETKLVVSCVLQANRAHFTFAATVEHEALVNSTRVKGPNTVCFVIARVT